MASSKLTTGAVIALATTGIFLSLVTAGIIATQTTPSYGTVTTVNLGVYSNSECTQNCTVIDWGSLYPGDATAKTIYVKNTGAVPVTITMNANTWNPTNADDYLTVAWNQQGTVLGVGQSVTANLILTADIDTGDLQDFSCNIVITGAE